MPADIALLPLAVLVKAASAYRTKKAAGPFDRMMNAGVRGLGNMFRKAPAAISSAYQNARPAIGQAVGTAWNKGVVPAAGAVRQGIGATAGAAARNPWATGALVGGAAMAPTGAFDALGHGVGLTSDPAKDYASHRATFDQTRNDHYNNVLTPMMQQFEAARTAGTVTPEMQQKLQKAQDDYRTGNFGGGWFSSSAAQHQAKAQAAGSQLTQPYQAPGMLGRFFGRAPDQQSYDRYTQNVMGNAGLKEDQYPTGWSPHRTPPASYSAMPFHHDVGGFGSTASLDPRGTALENLSSGKVQVPSPW